MQNYPKPSAYTVAFWTGLLVIVFLLGLSYRRAYSNAGYSPSVDWNLHRQNIAHAVGYADGTTALISPEQFAALDKSGFFELPAATPR